MMPGVARGVATLLGGVVALFLVYVATRFDLDAGAGEYWAAMGLLAAAGLATALSQLLGGWTKWGWPRVSGGVFLLGFLPVLVLGGWILLSAQPVDFFNTSNWSRDLGIGDLVDDLASFAGAVAFLVGLTFGFTFDTTGRVPRDGRGVASPATVPDRDRVAAEPVPEPPPEPAPRTGPPPRDET